MRNLLNFLARYNNLILFLLFEGIAFWLVVTGNQYQNSRVLKNIRFITVGVEGKITNVKSFLRLRAINEDLAQEVIDLRNKLNRIVNKDDFLFYSISDTVHRQQYGYTVAKIVNNSVNRQKNFFTLNKGLKQGVNVDMAVRSSYGAAGIIVSSSDNYSVAMSLLNVDFRLSVRMKSNGYYGSLTWDGKDFRHAVLNEIPQHVTVIVGDTVETTGFSAIFPDGVLVGVVSEFSKEGGDFYKIRVSLATEFKRLNFVDVISNLRRTEQTEVEKPFQ